MHLMRNDPHHKTFGDRVQIKRGRKEKIQHTIEPVRDYQPRLPTRKHFIIPQGIKIRKKNI
jgi:hypothetical protein